MFTAAELQRHLRPDGLARVQRKVLEARVLAELATTPAFHSLPSRALQQVVAMLETESAVAGDYLYTAGGPSDRVFLLRRGAIQLLRGRQPVATIARGTPGTAADAGSARGGADAAAVRQGLPLVGEMALLDRRPRTVAARAVCDCELLVLPVEQFAAFSLAVPDFRTRLRRLRADERRPSTEAPTA